MEHGMETRIFVDDFDSEHADVLLGIDPGCHKFIGFDESIPSTTVSFLFKKIFTRALTLALIPVTTIFSITSCFITVAAPGLFIDITDENETERIYMMHADSQVNFPTINRSALISSHIFACNGLCFLIYCLIAAQIFRAKVTTILVRNSDKIHLRKLERSATILPGIFYSTH
ncbi:hypothetical protein PRIPAC_90571 [Pristionchus pacificus]|uniref:Uncharacterized protein n=1 Tax=Pristionchus pacificus TaxID=54126 RepID=A0A2A6B633_PRIPA|nr:hypothetical protein PRIPAC_90571 [Pristionchus pacificus]|eukprot:PDM61332.1 hypothetical protein PRIPAC_50774 [Pristionchus pacificus]